MDGNFTQNSNQQNDQEYRVYEPNQYRGPVVVSNAIPEKNGALAVSSLVCGIIGLVGFWSVIPSAIIALVGLILGILNLAKKDPQKGMAIAGVVISVLALLLSLATGFGFLIVMSLL